MQLKKFIKNFVLLCGIYILIQGFHYTTVLAANNMDEPSVKSDITNSTNLHNTSPAKSTDDIQTGSPTENEENKNAEITNDLNAASKKIPDSAQISSADTAPAKTSDSQEISTDTTPKKNSGSTQTSSTTGTEAKESSASTQTQQTQALSTDSVSSSSKDNSTHDSTSDNKTYYKSSSKTENSSTFVKYNIPVSKSWKIKFSEPVDADSLEGKITVVDKNNTAIPITLSLTDNNKSVIVTPETNYDHDSSYTLIIKDIVSKYNRKLKNPTVVNFTTVPSISSIDDINETVNQEDSFDLPAQVPAKMSNGTTSYVDVFWNKSLDPTTTSIPGDYEFEGTVEDYDKPVTLKLTVKPFVPVQSISNDYRVQSQIGTNLYNYLMNYSNRQSVLERAIELHDGSTSNNCVFFASEALRRVGIDVPTSVANTLTLTSVLKNFGWKICYDLSLLLPGDICFTTNYGDGPTHTYTFMKWADPKSFDYGYICDNQGYDYDGDPYHIRNIDFATEQKDALSYFMYLA